MALAVGSAQAQGPDRFQRQDRSRGLTAPVAPAVAETTRVAEQIAVLKAINPINLTMEQTKALLDLIKPAQEKQSQQAQAGAGPMAAVIPQLRQAQALAETAPGQTTSAEMEYRRVEQNDAQARARLRDQLRRDLGALLEKILSPDQQRAAIATGHTLNVQQRLQELQSGDRGPIDGLARSLDQLRQADARRYPDERQSFAMRQAGVFGGGFRGGGGQGGPGGGGQGFRGGGGGDGGRRGGQGGQGGQSRRDQARGNEDALRQEQLRVQLSDPAVQARMRPYLSMADQIRRMPEASYQQQRTKLALQLWQANEERRIQTNPQQAMEQFLSRTLLTPAAVDVLEMKLQSAAAG